jgi:prepilin-type processing-associated H-X9-DG protein
MNPSSGRTKPTAFTLVELLAVIAIIAIMVLMLFPRHTSHGPAHRAQCLSNQRQLIIGLIIFAGDHTDNFPSAITMTDGGASEAMAIGDVVPCYVACTNGVQNPAVFRCSTDKQRSPAQAGAPLARTNVSYFVSLDASPTNSPTYSILTGDRHLEANNKPVAPGLFLLSTNQALAWTAELHIANKQPSGGAFGFADGHVEWVSLKKLSEAVARQSMATNRLAVP